MSKHELASLARTATVPVTKCETGATALNRSAHDWYVAIRDPIERKPREKSTYKMQPMTAHDMRTSGFRRV